VGRRYERSGTRYGGNITSSCIGSFGGYSEALGCEDAMTWKVYVGGGKSCGYPPVALMVSGRGNRPLSPPTAKTPLESGAGSRVELQPSRPRQLLMLLFLTTLQALEEPATTSSAYSRAKGQRPRA
jgi:hypothetical protein